MVSVIGERDLWDGVSSDDHNAVFDIFTEESKLVGERCRSGSATLKEKSSVTRFLVELGALEFTIHEAEKDGELQSSVRVSIPEQQERGSMLDVQQDESGNVVKQATGQEVTSELSAVADEHKDSDAGDSSDCGDIMDRNDDDDDDDDDEIPVWMRDPPAVEQTKEASDDLPELPEKETEPKDPSECPKCKSVFYNPWDFDLHYLKCSKTKKTNVEYNLRTDECDLCNTVVKRKALLFHFFKVHDLSYKDAIKKIPGYKERSALRMKHGTKRSTTPVVRCPLCKKVASNNKTMLLHLYKFHSLSYEEAHQKLKIKMIKSYKSAVTKRTESNCKRRKSQRIQTRKVLVVLRNLDENEINEMRHISDVETGSPRLPIADSIQDQDGSEIQSETEDKDIVQIKEECHERDTTQLEEGDEQPQETFPVALAKGEASYSVKDEGPFACDICDKEFDSQSEIPNHMIIVHFQCSTCLKTLTTKSNLKMHLETHKNKDTHTCPICQQKLKNKYTLAHHVKIHKKRECQFCHQKFSDADSLRNHLNQNHEQNKPFSCDQCDQAYFKKKHLQVHVKRKHGEVREKSWKCDQCGKGFYLESDVTIHKRKVHIPSGQHLCELCGAAYKSKHILAQHHLTAHTDSFKFTCDICGKKFKRSTLLNAHRKVHSNDRQFRCEVCGKGFRQRHKLNVHMDWHNDVRKFACTLCPKTFLTKGNLDKHQTVHTKMYKHSCDSCGHGFCDLSQLRLHLSRVHGIIVKSKITKGEREKNVQSKAKSPTIASAENQTNSGISAEIEPSTSTSTTENQSLSITGRIDMDEHVIDSETQVRNPAVLTVTSEASCGDDNLLATEVFTAMMHSHGIQ